MRFLVTSLSFLAVAGIAAGETPDGFTPAAPARLNVTYGTTSITPGMNMTIQSNEFQK